MIEERPDQPPASQNAFGSFGHSGARRPGADELLIGQTLAMQEVRDRIRRVAPRNNPVLIEGPTGSGKELVAQSLHTESHRRGRFVPINIAAISDTLFEAELFGHVRGAFSGAIAARTGLLRAAANGTVFLDEIGELSTGMQVKLLRVLESHEIWPVGSDVGQHVNLRVIAATNANLKSLVDRGSFREDLWHRLRGVTIRTPALRDHSSDIPALVEHFLDQIAREYHEPRVALREDAVRLLEGYAWPGNVRELRELVGMLALEAEAGQVTEAQVRRMLRSTTGQEVEVWVEPDTATTSAAREALYALLVKHRGSADDVATELGISRSAVYRRMQRYGVPGGRQKASKGA